MARGRQLRVSRGPRRDTVWLASAPETGLSSLAANTGVLDQSFTGAQISALGNGTIVRTRGSLWVMSDQKVALEAAPVGLGMVVVTEKARAAGVSALPAPLTQASADFWFVHRYALSVAQVGATADGLVGGSAWFDRVDFDSKAMRTVEDGEAIVVMLENLSGTAGIQYVIAFRMLYKLH